MKEKKEEKIDLYYIKIQSKYVLLPLHKLA